MFSGEWYMKDLLGPNLFTFFCAVWNFSFNFTLILPSSELSVALDYIFFLYTATVIFLKYFIGYFTCNNFLVGGYDFSNDPIFLFRE
jgi:hypothetical protein